jgi:protein tyrosine/serine phosphatase
LIHLSRQHLHFFIQPLDDKPVFENLHNFRQAGGISLQNRHGQKIRDGLLFRSSRTDYLTDEEVGRFLQLDIKAIIDLRRNAEYVKADGPKILDRNYKPCILKKGVIKDWKDSRTKSPDNDDLSPKRRKRYLVNLMTIELMKKILMKVNFFVRYSSLVLLVVDWFFNCHLFVRLHSHLVSNHQTLAEQYVTMLEYTKPVVVDIMKLLLKDDNLPVLIHCAHGKDRTGVIIALILGCLEVEDEVIVQDYALSEVRINRFVGIVG